VDPPFSASWPAAVDRDLAEHWSDVVIDVVPAPLARVGLHVEQFEVPILEPVDVRLGARIALFVDLADT
jgi:hypothetical protein